MSEPEPNTFRHDCFFVSIRLIALWLWVEALLRLLRLPAQVMQWRYYHANFGKEVEVNHVLGQAAESAGMTAMATTVQLLSLVVIGWLLRRYSKNLAAWLGR